MAQEEYRVECGDMTAVFNRKGVLVDILNRGVGMLDNSPDGPAWTIVHRGGTFTSLQYDEPPFVSHGGGETTFRWEQAGLPSVVASVRALPEEDGFAFTCGVENETEQRLDDLRCPAEFRLKIQSDDDYLCVVQNNHFDDILTPLRTLKEFEGCYPGTMEMQFSGFRIGGDALLFYTDDADSYVKYHGYASKDDILTFTLTEYIALAPGEFWEPEYATVLRFLPGGDYNDMAHKYGEWARRQPWARRKMADKIAEIPSLDRILTDGLVRFDSFPAGKAHRQTAEDSPWEYVSDPEQNPGVQYEPYYDENLKMFARHERLYGINPGWWIPIWSGRRFDSHWPDYFPVEEHMGDFEKFKAECIRQGFTFLPHLNTIHWAIYNMPEEIRPRYMAAQDGSPYLNWKFAGVRQVVLNLARSFELERPTVQRISSESDHAGIYLDVFAQAFCKDNSAGSPFGRYANGYQRAKIHQLRSVRKIISGPVMSEGRNEVLLPYSTRTFSLSPNINGRLLNWCNMVYSVNFSHTAFQIAEITDASTTRSITQSLELIFTPWQKFNFSFLADHYMNQLTEDQFKNLVLVDFKAEYTINDRWQLIGSVTNLLGQNNYDYKLINSMYAISSYTSYRIRPRNFLLSLYFKF